MAFPVILNGRTYTLADFEGTNYVDGFPDALEDFVTQAGDIYNSTSTSSVAIGTGSKSFTTADSGKPYQEGTPLRIADAAAPETNFMDCIVTSYSGTSLVVESIGFGGSGTKSSWTINIGGAKTVDGTLAINQGGTGATTASAAASALGLGTEDSPEFTGLTVTSSGDFSGATISDLGTVTTADINGGTIDNTVIGGSTPAAGSFTTVTGSGDMNIDSGTLFVDVSEDRVGIGTTSPDKQVDIEDASEAELRLLATGANALTMSAIGFPNEVKFEKGGSNGPLSFYNPSTKRMDISADGDISFYEDTGTTPKFFWDASAERLGIGTSSPDGKMHLFTASAGTVTAASGADELVLENSGTVGMTFLCPNTSAANIIFGDPDDNNIGGIQYGHATDYMSFTTNASEAMRLDSSGNLLVGGPSPDLVNSTRAYFERNINSSSNSNTVTDQNTVVNIDGNIGTTNSEAATSLLCLTGNSGLASTPGRLIKGYGGNGATTHCFEVQHDGDVLNTNNTYGSISDERAKQDITDASSSWDDIKNIRIRKYRLKSNVEEYANNPNLGDAPYHIGVISQEVETVSPGLIKQDLLADGTPDPDAMKHVKYSVLYMKAVKALQEAIARIETLEAEVAALKGA